SVAPSNNLLLINSLKRATTITTFSSVPTAFPSITFMLVQLLLYLISVPFFLVLFVSKLYFLSFPIHAMALVRLSLCHAFANHLFFEGYWLLTEYFYNLRLFSFDLCHNH